MKRLALALALIAIPSLATTVPPTVTAANVTVAENIGSGLAPFALVKTKGSSYSKVHVQTVDGTAKAGVDYRALDAIITLGNSAQTWSLPIAIIDNATYQGTRSFTVRLTCTRYCSAQTAPVTVTITDDEPAPAPQWVSAPLTSGGYARCKAVCHGFAAPYPTVIAQQGDVWLYAWNGVSSGTSGLERIQIGAFWPIGQYKVAGVGVEGFADEWEGVVPGP